jgi:hypothetical protein
MATMLRRFPPPWIAVSTEGGWRVDDATGRPLVYVYGRDDATGVGSHGLTIDEARRLAANIARLPELSRGGDGPGRTDAIDA